MFELNLYVHVNLKYGRSQAYWYDYLFDLGANAISSPPSITKIVGTLTNFNGTLVLLVASKLKFNNK
jgi:hypothetical protein